MVLAQDYGSTVSVPGPKRSNIFEWYGRRGSFLGDNHADAFVGTMCALVTVVSQPALSGNTVGLITALKLLMESPLSVVLAK